MSKFLDDSLALVNQIALGGAEDAATKQAVSDLTTRLTADEATEADLVAINTALLNKLAASTPAPTTSATADGTAAPAA